MHINNYDTNPWTFLVWSSSRSWDVPSINGKFKSLERNCCTILHAYPIIFEGTIESNQVPKHLFDEFSTRKSRSCISWIYYGFLEERNVSGFKLTVPPKNRIGFYASTLRFCGQSVVFTDSCSSSLELLFGDHNRFVRCDHVSYKFVSIRKT